MATEHLFIASAVGSPFRMPACWEVTRPTNGSAALAGSQKHVLAQNPGAFEFYCQRVVFAPLPYQRSRERGWRCTWNRMCLGKFGCMHAAYLNWPSGGSLVEGRDEARGREGVLSRGNVISCVLKTRSRFCIHLLPRARTIP